MELFEYPTAQKIIMRFENPLTVESFEKRLGFSIACAKEITFPTKNQMLQRRFVDRLIKLTSGDWKKHWLEMPEFVQEKVEPYRQLIVYIDDDDESRAEFSAVAEQNITAKTQSIWYPKRPPGECKGLSWYSSEDYHPAFPVYVISKARSATCITSRALDRMGVAHKVVIEPCDYSDYQQTLGADKLLQLPFSNLGQGSIPARNWVWQHSLESGSAWHWILDDNIHNFYRLNRNEKIKVRTGAIFKAAEDFVLRYDNIGKAGFHYDYFCKADQRLPAYYLNTRVYSCILLRNDGEFRWRGKYNEDTDLSLRILKSGLCTVLFAAFLAGKMGTLKMKGGNTDFVYVDGDNRRKFAESLVKQHPDVAKVVWKFGRWHHHVDYRGFKDTASLNLKAGVKLTRQQNDYGMVLRRDECFTSE